MASDRELPNSPLDPLVWLLATGLGLGKIPKAPGTFGSVLGLPVASGVQQLPPAWQYVAAAIVFLVGIPICHRGAQLLHAKDPGGVVFDEIAAFPVIFLFAPLTPLTAVVGFVLFRFFDVTKLPPAGWAERFPGGLGIMADDLVAGIYSGAVLWGLSRWLAV